MKQLKRFINCAIIPYQIKVKNTLRYILLIFLFFTIQNVKCVATIPVGNSITIQLSHYVNNHILQLDVVQNNNSLGQPFTISRFRYYISNIHLITDFGKEYISNEYFLVDEEEKASKIIQLKNVPEGSYAAISFTLGVDSLHNCSGVQSGALDPANGMFWAWNTGYIFLKLEGHSTASNSPGNIFEYHIGGYRSPNNSIRSIKLNLGNNGLRISSLNNASIALRADIDEILQTPTIIDFSKLSSVTDFKNAGTIADNYCDMFTIIAVN